MVECVKRRIEATNHSPTHRAQVHVTVHLATLPRLARGRKTQAPMYEAAADGRRGRGLSHTPR